MSVVEKIEKLINQCVSISYVFLPSSPLLRSLSDGVVLTQDPKGYFNPESDSVDDDTVANKSPSVVAGDTKDQQ